MGRLRVATLASGSWGNAVLVSYGGTHFLVDCGVSYRYLEKSLYPIGLHPKMLSAVVLTHEHTDHTRGLPRFMKMTDVPVYASSNTAFVLDTQIPISRIRIFSPRDIPLRFDGASLHPFALSHDAAEPLGFRIELGGYAVVIATDTGIVPRTLVKYARESDLLLIEANYDEELLFTGHYPEYLKKRISGPLGHLSNSQAAEVIRKSAGSRLGTVMLTHLSEHNNRPELVRSAAERTLTNGVNLIVCKRRAPTVVEL